MNFGNSGCREYGLKNCFAKDSFYLYLTRTEVKYVSRVLKFLNNLEKFLGFGETTIKLEPLEALKVSPTQEWNHNPILFSLYLTAIRTAFSAKSEDPFDSKGIQLISIYSNEETKRSYADFKAAIPLMNKINKLGMETIFAKSKKFWLISPSKAYVKYGINGFLNTTKGSSDSDKKRANTYLKKNYKIK